MKIPSLFGRLPLHRRFNFTPRFYDAQEEERMEREKRVLMEIKIEEERKKELEESVKLEPVYRSQIAGAIQSARRTARRNNDPSATLLRLIIMTFLALMLVAYFQFGNIALYGFLVLIPFYLFIRLRSAKKDT